MRKWGWIVTVFYGLIVLGLLVPLFAILDSTFPPTTFFRSSLYSVYRAWTTWVSSAIVILCQVLLLWMSVDTSRQRLKPRTPVAITAITAGFLFMFLVFAIAVSLMVATWGDNPPDWFYVPLIVLAASWILWGILFYRLWRDSADPVTHAVKWLFRGSVLELLVALPAHVITRRRHDCCAPTVTGFGIAAGIAIMLLSFGPSVLPLFRKRMERNGVRNPARQSI